LHSSSLLLPCFLWIASSLSLSFSFFHFQTDQQAYGEKKNDDLNGKFLLGDGYKKKTSKKSQNRGVCEHLKNIVSAKNIFFASLVLEQIDVLSSMVNKQLGKGACFDT